MKSKGKLGKISVKVGVNSSGFHLANAHTNVSQLQYNTHRTFASTRTHPSECFSFHLPNCQEMIESFSFENVEWDVSSGKFVMDRKDHSLHLIIHTKKVFVAINIRCMAEIFC